MEEPPFWCSVCGKDLQSQAALAEHEQGRKHWNKLFQMDHPDNAKRKRPISMSSLPPIEEEEFFESIAAGKHKNIVVLSGAGISTNAGVPDYRSKNGFFDKMLQDYSQRFPEVGGAPEILFSRAFANRHPDVWREELLPKTLFVSHQILMRSRMCSYAIGKF